ncbi:MAG: PP2C family protein-serine/threonine phosphatase [Bryobacteraceae bacterium]
MKPSGTGIRACVGLLRRLGRVDRTFCLLLLLYLPLALLKSASAFVPILQFALILLGAWILLRISRKGMQKAIWRLRNRLLVTYLFIAVVPVLLIATLAGLGAYLFIGQLAVHLVTSELDRRVTSLRFIGETVARAGPADRSDMGRRMVDVYGQRFPGLEITVEKPNPPAQWRETTGVVLRAGSYYAWSRIIKGPLITTVMAPLTRAYLSGMASNLGDVSLLDISEEHTNVSVKGNDGEVTFLRMPHEGPANPLPPPVNRLDVPLTWWSIIPIARWEKPGKTDTVFLRVYTRPSAVFGTLFNTGEKKLDQVIPLLLLAVAILFFIVEVVSLVIGVRLTRTITRAVHNLYRGTQRVIEGDFSHRITVHGKDQLGELSNSFNNMTENLEKLLVIAKEKERLQAEVEIAREVQEQLYPKALPPLRTVRLMATCKPARMVSGDYYDYLCLPDSRLALAIGDVAGKGISAALLMATIQAAMRMELRSPLVAAAPAGLALAQVRLPPARLVSDLNQQLYATTAPEKYATFFFAFYDELTSQLSYTNAGHLPPFVVRNGSAAKLDVNGTVVGAFPFSQYEESSVQMESGDLLVCYTDGITEPENEYGEMFGEERLIELVTKNAERDENAIASLIMDAVAHWATAEEQPDDMTLLLARKT